MFPTVIPVHAVCNRLVSDIYVKRDMHVLSSNPKSRPRNVLVITTSSDFNETQNRSKHLTQLLCDLPGLQREAERQTGDKVARIDIRAA